MIHHSVVLLAVFYVVFGFVSAATKNVVCYHGTWSKYRTGNGKFGIEDIDPTLCTHVIYSFVGINSDGTIRLLDSYLDVDLGNLKKFTSLKDKNPNLKLLVAIGGWNEGSDKFSIVAASASKRVTFVNSAVTFLKSYGLDGFDIDWEYPCQRGGGPVDKLNYAKLLKEFRTEFDKYGYILTAAVSAGSGAVDISYDVPSLSKYLDIINVMAYDLHGIWDGVAGQNAPLYASSVDVTAVQKTLNVDAAIQGWIKRGADPGKIALGLGAYGRTFTLTNPSNNGVGAAASNVGNPGPYTSTAGSLGYNEICELLKVGGWTEVWDDIQKTPYMYKDKQWVGYDNPKSIKLKVEYAKSNNLGGLMLWSLETDDFKGLCGKPFGLLNAVKEALEENSGDSSSDDQSDGNNDSDNGNNSDNSNDSNESNSDNNHDSNDDDNSNNSSDNDNNSDNSKDEVVTTPNPGTTKSSNSVTTKSSNSGTTKSSNSGTTESSNSGRICSQTGYTRDMLDCSVFYYCLPLGNNNWVPLKQQCGGNLVFDINSFTCNYPQSVQC